MVGGVSEPCAQSIDSAASHAIVLSRMAVAPRNEATSACAAGDVPVR